MNNTLNPDFLDIFNMSTGQLLNQMKLSNVEFGRVTSVTPLVITLDSKVPLTAAFLTLTNAVKDHSVDISVSWNTEDNTHKHGNDGQPTAEVTHKHQLRGRKRITVHNGLTLGERVILLRKQGGQDYIVLDRVDEPETTGESL